MENVAEVTVFGEKNLITGNIVCARVRLVSDESIRNFALRLKHHCRLRLQTFKVPVRVIVDQELQYTERFKKSRKSSANAPALNSSQPEVDNE